MHVFTFFIENVVNISPIKVPGIHNETAKNFRPEDIDEAFIGNYSIGKLPYLTTSLKLKHFPEILADNFTESFTESLTESLTSLFYHEFFSILRLDSHGIFGNK